MQILKDESQYEKAKEESAMLIVLVGSKKCLPCASIKSKICEWLKDHKRVNSIYIPIESFPFLTSQENIFCAPTLLLFCQNKRYLFYSGYFSLQEFLQKCEMYEDMIFSS